MRWKNRAEAILLILAALLFFALAPGRDSLFLLLFLLAVLILGAALAMTGSRRLSHKLKLPETVEKNGNFQGELQLENLSGIPAYGCCTVHWKNELTGESGKSSFSFAVGRKKMVRMPFTGKSAYCGKISFETAEWFSCDPWRIFWKKRNFTDRAQVLIFPEITEFAAEFAGNEQYDMESLEYSESRKGDDVNETFDLREYQPGDSMHRVHWKLTEKLGKMIVRESGYPVKNRILILLETSCEPGSEPKGQEAAAGLTASLLHALVQQGITCELGLFDYTAETFQRISLEREEQLFEAEQLLVSAGRKKEDHSGIWHYLAGEPEGAFSNCVYITAGPLPEELWLLKEYGKVSVISFDEKEAADTGITVFSAEDWKKQIGTRLLLGE